MSVQLTSTQAFTLSGADIEITYDNTRFSVTNVQLGSLDNGTGFSTFGAPDDTTGNLQISVFTFGAGNAIGIGTVGTLETFTLTALANAPVSGSQGNLNLMQSIGQTITGVYGDSSGNAIVLTPAPTNGYDAGVDATVLVSGVPEPSSLALMGIGGLSSLVVLLRKKKARRAVAA